MRENPSESKRAFVTSHCPQLDYSEQEILDLINLLDQQGAFDAPTGELSIAFVEKDRISQLHKQFMDDPTPTDVITFQGDIEDAVAGEICVCPEVAQDYTAANNKNFSEELTLYLIHGYLHLCGFDDLETEDRSEMRNAETQAMELVKQSNAIPTFTIRDV